MRISDWSAYVCSSYLAWWLAGVLLVIGTIAALAAMGAGLFEFARIAEGSPALVDARRHMLLAMAAWVFYAASLLLRLEGTTLVAPEWPALATSLAGFLCLGAAGWLGGKLVYQHRDRKSTRLNSS